MNEFTCSEAPYVCVGRKNAALEINPYCKFQMNFAARASWGQIHLYAKSACMENLLICKNRVGKNDLYLNGSDCIYQS